MKHDSHQTFSFNFLTVGERWVKNWALEQLQVLELAVDGDLEVRVYVKPGVPESSAGELCPFDHQG